MTGQDSVRLPHIMIHAITAEKRKSCSATGFIMSRDGFLTSALITGSIFTPQEKTSYAAEEEAALLPPAIMRNELPTEKRKWIRSRQQALK